MQFACTIETMIEPNASYKDTPDILFQDHIINEATQHHPVEYNAKTASAT